MTVFVCGEQVDDIWSGIYDAWMSRLGHANVRLEPEGCNRELFCDYRQVERSEEKAAKVVSSIRSKLTEDIYEMVFKAALSQDADRADMIYRFLIYAFHVGSRIIDMLQVPAVFEIFRMNRNLGMEFSHMQGFTRFSQMEEGILLGKIGPKNDLTVLLANHFADRLSGENWILYDCNRKKAAVHQAGDGWVMVQADSGEWQSRLQKATDENEYEILWKSFCESIAIKERRNPGCQMNMLPLRFRPFMTEFQ
ncbi:MAG: TIGR03915 family putative DNA repair protein [Lachnospiraceae bacterium]